ncbi:MAG: response regulator [Spirochaetia bacterium]|nr:response regulator [Spirochaetia bacterium]
MRFLLALICGTLFATLACSAPKKPPVARGGTLDLSSWNFDQDGPVFLNGEWEIYWNHFYSADDFADPEQTTRILSERRFITVPGDWNTELKAEFPGSSFGDGYATLRLRLTLNDTSRLVVFNTLAGSAFRLYCGDRLIRQSGVPNTTKDLTQPEAVPTQTPLGACPGGDLIWQIANFHHAYGGPRYPLRLSTLQNAQRLNTLKDLGDMVLIGATFLAFTYHFLLWLLLRRDKKSLFFSLMCLCLSTLGLSSEKIFQRILSYNVYALEFRLEFLSVTIGLLTTYLFVRSLYPREAPRWVAVGLTFFAVPFSIAVALAPVRVFTMGRNAMQTYILVGLVLILFSTVRAALRGRKNAAALLAGLAFLLCTTANDILVLRHYYSGLRLAPLGFFGLIFSQSAVLARMFAAAQRTAEHLSENLQQEVDIKTHALLQTNAELLEADRAKTTFFQNISHDLRSPLTLIMGYVDFARSKGEALTGESLRIVDLQARRLLRLVNQLLDMQRLASGRMALVTKPVDFGTLAVHVLASFDPFARQRSVQLRSRISEGLPVVRVDIDKMERCLYNFLSNALKFTPEGGTVRLSVTRDNGGIKVEVADSGKGVEPGRQNTLFRRFGHTSGGLVPGQEGTGLGLSLVKEFVELHGGVVGFSQNSDPEMSGAAFWFTLPGAPAGTEAVPLSEHEITAIARSASIEAGILTEQRLHQEETPLPTAKAEILAVDDDPAIRDLIQAVLRHAGYHVETAEHPEAAWKALAERRPHIIISDVSMPGMSGPDFIRRVRSDLPGGDVLPVIFLTAHAEAERKAELEQAGGNSVLTKPFRRDDLIYAVESLLRPKS